MTLKAATLAVMPIKIFAILTTTLYILSDRWINKLIELDLINHIIIKLAINLVEVIFNEFMRVLVNIIKSYKNNVVFRLNKNAHRKCRLHVYYTLINKS